MFLRKPARRTRTVLHVEQLESRETPAGNITTSLVNGSLTLTGDELGNHVVVSQPNPSLIVLTPLNNTSINGHTSPVTIANVIHDLNIRLGKGDDTLDFDLSKPIVLMGNLNIDYASSGGIGIKTTETLNAKASGLIVAKNVTILYAAGKVGTTFDNLTVGGNVTIRHNAGDSTFTLDNLQGADTFSTVYGNLTVVNTEGLARNRLNDTNVVGNVSFANGRATSSPNPGFTFIGNTQNQSTQSTIGGNLTVSNLSGNPGNDFRDFNVKGNMTVGLGSGFATLMIESGAVSQRPVVGGNLTITGSGVQTMTLGDSSGLVVKGALIIRTGTASQGVYLNRLQVNGVTSIATGGGDDIVVIDRLRDGSGSQFAGMFRMNTGDGEDTVRVNSDSAVAATQFQRGVEVSLGAGNDSLFLATVGNVQFEALNSLPIIFDAGTGNNVASVTFGNLPNRVPSFLHFSPTPAP